MLLLSKNERYKIYRKEDFINALQYDVDVTDSGVPVVYEGGALFPSDKFNQPIGGWDMSSVDTLSSMFYRSKFNQPINGWDTSRVRVMVAAFMRSKYDRPLTAWDLHSVTYSSNAFWRAGIRAEYLPGLE